MNVALVGEVNPYGGDPEYSLFPAPAGCAGWRLQRLLGLTRATYMRLKRVNLCAGTWSMPDAREAAARLLSDPPTTNGRRVFVLLGRRVGIAFGLDPGTPFFRAHGVEVRPPADPKGDDAMRVVLVHLPHPSGLCRLWSEPGAAERARALLRDAAPSIPWGEA